MTRLMRFAAAALAVPMAAAAVPALAQDAPTCARYENIEQFIAHNFQEKRDAVGLTEKGEMVEIYAGRDGSWTMVLAKPDGRACIIGAGQAWQSQIAQLDPGA